MSALFEFASRNPDAFVVIVLILVVGVSYTVVSVARAWSERGRS